MSSARLIRLMPQGVMRACTVCTFCAYTVHTERIPCPVDGCAGELGWPSKWPHICSRGHGQVLEVVDNEVPTKFCATCAPGQDLLDGR